MGQYYDALSDKEKKAIDFVREKMNAMDYVMIDDAIAAKEYENFFEDRPFFESLDGKKTLPIQYALAELFRDMRGDEEIDFFAIEQFHKYCNENDIVPR